MVSYDPTIYEGAAPTKATAGPPRKPVLGSTNMCS
jgi:hypothetical protein